jgi:hypothetical protein
LRYLFITISSLLVFSCKQNNLIVPQSFVDSLVSNYRPSTSAITNSGDLVFWKSRVDSLPQSFVNLQKYGAALAARFHIYGAISDLIGADSIMKELAAKYPEPGYYLSLAGLKMLQHRFAEARTLIDTVISWKSERYAAQMMSFDANFELGNVYEASQILKRNYAPQDYAYNFRLSKQDHYLGELDSAIRHMVKAADLSAGNPYLRSAALSNAADLCIHEGNLKEAAELYMQCIRFNSSDFHSMNGLGWIALVHDRNETLANNLFSFVREKIKSPDPLLKQSQANELTDLAIAKEYAVQFIKQVSDPAYGNMYNKYMIQIYTGVLPDAAAALDVAQREIRNRATAQTYAWLAWCLFLNGEKEKAYDIYKDHISGKPLEALELYWMGKMMKGLNKGYNAQQFFKAAEKNKYDLSPALIKDLEENI